MMIKPKALSLNKEKTMLKIDFADKEYTLSSEFLRVHSPSAEVMGHGPGQEVLQVGKEDITITSIKPVGNYAVIFVFSDNHDSGIYSWDYLHNLCTNQNTLWQKYLTKLQQAKHHHSHLNN